MTIPVGFIEATYNFTGTGAPNGSAVVCGHQFLSGGTVEATANLLFNNFAAEVMPVLASEVTLQSVDVKFGPDDTGAIGTSTSSAAAGGDGGNATAPNTAYLIKKGTAIGGRRSRGRMFLPGVGEAYVDAGGNVTGAKQTAINVAVLDWLLLCESTDVPLFLLHDPSTIWVLVDGQPRRQPTGAPPPAPTVITTLTCGAKVATQRRRLR